MKKTWLIRILLLIAYCVPYAFLSINGDATSGTMLFYGVMVVAFSLLCWGAIKTNNFAIVFIGNVLSFISSYTVAIMGDLEAMAWYFKPFTAQSLLIAISIVVTVIQIIVAVVCRVKAKAK